MAITYLMQAADSVDGSLHFWAYASADYAAAGYPGGGTATDVTVAAVTGAEAGEGGTGSPGGSAGQLQTNNGSGGFAGLAFGATGAALISTGSGVTFGRLDLSDTDGVTGTLPLTRGGLGITSVGATGSVAVSTGTGITFGRLDLADTDGVTGVLPNGNIATTLTGKTINTTDNSLTSTSGATGDILVHTGTKYERLAKGATGTYLGVNESGIIAYGIPSTTPGGTDGQFQYNNNGALSGSPNLTIDGLGYPVVTSPTIVSPYVTSGLYLEDSAETGEYVIAPGDCNEDSRILSLPNLSGDDTFAVTGATQTLSSKTLASPTITGAITISSYTSATTTSNDGKVTIVDATVSAQTTNATPAVAYSSGTLADEAVHLIDVVVTAIKSDGSAAAMYKRSYAGRRDGGTWTQLAAVGDNGTEETTSAWDCTVGVASNVFEVTVTGESATTIRWGVSVRIQSTVP